MRLVLRLLDVVDLFAGIGQLPTEYCCRSTCFQTLMNAGGTAGF